MLLLAIGLGAGVLSGMLGIGGGLVIVPALTIFGHFTMQRATGTSLGALLLPVGALGVWSYYKAGNVDFRASMLLALGLLIGVAIGAQLVQHLSEHTLKRMFSVLLVVAAAKLWMS